MLPAVRRGTDDLRSSGGDIAVRRPTHGGLLQAPWRGVQAQFHRPTGFQVQFQFGIGPGFELLIVFSYSERGLLMYDRSTSQDVTVDAHELLIRSFLPSFLPRQQQQQRPKSLDHNGSAAVQVAGAAMFRRETMYSDSLPFVTSNCRSAVEDLEVTCRTQSAWDRQTADSPGTVPGCDGIYDPSLLVTEAFSSVGDGQLPDSRPADNMHERVLPIRIM
ncbi:hypothetical protein B296_00044988 [Ensete ventricosum]|uniref:Uncharacterized protein n=1 Tax=Ensete ventricosum TaxID=4639 RepID=A0A426Y3A9_ENSVE|nr:hypothetical protein B296_00044988 [Ensete ventricosum]